MGGWLLSWTGHLQGGGGHGARGEPDGPLAPPRFTRRGLGGWVGVPCQACAPPTPFCGQGCRAAKVPPRRLWLGDAGALLESRPSPRLFTVQLSLRGALLRRARTAPQGRGSSWMAQRLTKLAFDASMDKRRVTPYSKGASEAFDMVRRLGGGWAAVGRRLGGWRRSLGGCSPRTSSRDAQSGRESDLRFARVPWRHQRSRRQVCGVLRAVGVLCRCTAAASPTTSRCWWRWWARRRCEALAATAAEAHSTCVPWWYRGLRAWAARGQKLWARGGGGGAARALHSCALAALVDVLAGAVGAGGERGVAGCASRGVRSSGGGVCGSMVAARAGGPGVGVCGAVAACRRARAGRRPACDVGRCQPLPLVAPSREARC